MLIRRRMPDRGEIGGIGQISTVGQDELSVEWRIHDALSLDGGNEYWYRSHFFVFGDEDEEYSQWYLSLYPNWKQERRCPESGWMRLALDRCDSGPAETFHVSVGIKGSGGVEKSREVEKEFSGYFNRECNNNYYHYWDDFCSRYEMTKLKTTLMPAGILTIICHIKKVVPITSREAEILLESEKNVLKSKEDSKVTLEEQAVDELHSSLQSLLKSEEDCDVVVKVQGKEFRAHRLILRMRSPVFQAMFSHNMLEKQKGVVTMEDCDQDTFPAFLEHIYTGNLGMISTENVFGLYSSSEKYDLKTLKKACAEFMKDNLTVSSFCDAITLAVKHDDKELIDRATEFFCNNTLDIVKTAEWQIFLTENPTVGNKLYIKQLTK